MVLEPLDGVGLELQALEKGGIKSDPLVTRK